MVGSRFRRASRRDCEIVRLTMRILYDTIKVVKTIRETEVYKRWFIGLRDTVAKARILVRLRRASLGNYGDVRDLGDHVSEFRFFFGPGYRIYFTEREGEIIILLAGGDKSTQAADIIKAKAFAANL